MNNITLKNLSLKNFKGIKDLEIEFSKVTNISGENATGKTTIFDAFTYLMFDKDSQDRSKFAIQPLDPSNNVMHMVDTEVEGTLDVNGKTIILKKVLKEKWTRKRGEDKAELKGTETSYYINEVPSKMGEYKIYISNLVDENLFKLLSNPLYFSTNMKWEDRRKVLLDIIGDISTDEIINYKDSLKALGKLLADNDIDTFKKQIQAKKRKLNDDKKSIPSRVDECNRSIVNEIDFEVVKLRKRKIHSEIESIEEQITDSSKVGEEVLKDKEKLYQLKSQLQTMEWEIKSNADKPLQKLKDELRDATMHIAIERNKFKGIENDNRIHSNSIQQKEAEKAVLKKTWREENTKTFILAENEMICPTCLRPFETDDVEAKRTELEGNFNKRKAEILKNITKSGQSLNSKIEELKHQIANSQDGALETNLATETKLLEKLNKQIEDFNPESTQENNVEYKALKTKITEFETKLNGPEVINTKIQDLKVKKSSLEFELIDANNQLVLENNNKKMETRITELMDEEKKLAQQLATLEGQEFLCEEFIKTKVELLENGINSEFKFVTFKLFEDYKNGGLSECCEILVDGIPFSNANTAGQINAGIDVINTLSNYYKVETVIFIDNRESINQLIETDSQVINLIVSKDKTLIIESEDK
jgi:exonuclease SbcC